MTPWTHFTPPSDGEQAAKLKITTNLWKNNDVYSVVLREASGNFRAFHSGSPAQEKDYLINWKKCCDASSDDSRKGEKLFCVKIPPWNCAEKSSFRNPCRKHFSLHVIPNQTRTQRDERRKSSLFCCVGWGSEQTLSDKGKRIMFLCVMWIVGGEMMRWR